MFKELELASTGGFFKTYKHISSANKAALVGA